MFWGVEWVPMKHEHKRGRRPEPEAPSYTVDAPSNWRPSIRRTDEDDPARVEVVERVCRKRTAATPDRP